MNISVKTNELKEKNGSTVAIANVEFGDQIKIKNITVKEGKNGKFVAMPSYQTNKIDEQGNPVYQEVFNPITAKGRESLVSAIMESMETGKEVIIKDDVERAGNGITARVVPLENSGNGTAGIGRIYLNEDFVINNITVRENKDGGMFVSFPSYKSNEIDEQGKAVYKDFAYPKDKSSRDKVTQIVMAAYTEAKELSKVPLSKDDKPKEEVLKDEKPRGVKAKLKDGEKKSKENTTKSIDTPKKSKETVIE